MATDADHRNWRQIRIPHPRCHVTWASPRPLCSSHPSDSSSSLALSRPWPGVTSPMPIEKPRLPEIKNPSVIDIVSAFSQPFKEKRISGVVRIGSIVIFYLSKLWKAKFFILCDVIFLVRLLGKFDIDYGTYWERTGRFGPFSTWHLQPPTEQKKHSFTKQNATRPRERQTAGSST